MAESPNPPDPPPGEPRPAPRRRRFGCVVIGLLTAVGLLILATVSVFVVSAGNWRKFEERHAVLSSGMRAQPPPPRLVPVTGPGNAWDDYRAALEDQKRVVTPEQRDAVIAALGTAAEPEDLLTARACLHDSASWLDLLRKGAGRASAAYPYAHERGAFAEVQGLSEVRFAAQLLSFSAAEKRAAGDPAGALEDLTLGLQLATDTAGIPTMIGALVGNAASQPLLEILHAWLTDPAASPEQIAALAGLLEQAERGIPSWADQIEREHCVTNETMRYLAQHPEAAEGTGLSGAAGMRLSAKLMAPDVDRKMAALARTAREAEGLAWPEARALIEARTSEIESSWNVFAAMLVPALGASARSDRLLRTRFALLRAAAHERLGRSEGTWPQDPFTRRPVARALQDGAVVLWSPLDEGPDTGSGGWEATNTGDLEKRDLVIRIPR
ncbi:MAG: hypothetical protein HUU15_05290 [Candidatus Brocadiae bacterium]|nr:hypothetical protein [Candidatus Brocadiia bacterium]